MKTKFKISFSIILLAFLVSISNVKAQDSTKIKHSENKHNMEMMNDSTNKMEMDKKGVKDSIVREGEIDLRAIDEDKDGYVYQDVMDYNVISDKPGKCPICGMTLKKVSLKKAKDVLTKNGYKVKQ